MSLNFGHNALIVGVGPVGAMLAVPLIKAGYNVTLAGRYNSEYTNYIKKNGIKINYPSGEIYIIIEQKNIDFVDTFTNLNRKFDLVIVAVKSNNLTKVASYISKHLKSDSILVHAQNGIPYWWFNDNEYISQLGEKLRSKIEKKRYLDSVDPGGKILSLLGGYNLIGCVVKAPSNIHDLGSINIRKNPQIILGITNFKNYNQKDLDLFDEFCALLNENGLNTQNSLNIRYEVCKKLAVNITNNTLTALTSTVTYDLIKNHFSKNLFSCMLEEANTIFNKFGINEENLPTREGLFKYIEAPGFQKYPLSMAQDFFQHREGEISLISAPVEMAQIAEIKVPILESISRLLKAAQEYVLNYKGKDTNLLLLRQEFGEFILNPNIYRNTQVERIKILDLLPDIIRLNLVRN